MTCLFRSLAEKRKFCYTFEISARFSLLMQGGKCEARRQSILLLTTAALEKMRSGYSLISVYVLRMLRVFGVRKGTYIPGIGYCHDIARCTCHWPVYIRFSCERLFLVLSVRHLMVCQHQKYVYTGLRDHGLCSLQRYENIGKCPEYWFR